MDTNGEVLFVELDDGRVFYYDKDERVLYQVTVTVVSPDDLPDEVLAALMRKMAKKPYKTEEVRAGAIFNRTELLDIITMLKNKHESHESIKLSSKG